MNLANAQRLGDFCVWRPRGPLSDGLDRWINGIILGISSFHLDFHIFRVYRYTTNQPFISQLMWQYDSIAKFRGLRGAHGWFFHWAPRIALTSSLQFCLNKDVFRKKKGKKTEKKNDRRFWGLCAWLGSVWAWGPEAEGHIAYVEST